MLLYIMVYDIVWHRISYMIWCGRTILHVIVCYGV